MTDTTTTPKTITITIDQKWKNEIDNYNRYRSASSEALKAEFDVLINPESTDKECTRASRNQAKAANLYTNACMSMGLAIAYELRKQGVEIDG